MQIVVRAAVLYLFIWLVTRGMGRKELSELSAFELILFVVFGDLIQQGVTGDDRSITGAALAVTTFALLTVAFSYVSFRWRPAQRVLTGVPVIIVRDGRILEDVLALERLQVDDVKDGAREQGVDDLADVEVGVLEADGKFSFLRYSGERPPRGGQTEHAI
ncbi:MAG: DUF421 domain-containing protein [Actinomycetota bacterium]|jgi:uncharacterized membrane protein YcaP (DUF421 family)